MTLKKEFGKYFVTLSNKRVIRFNRLQTACAYISGDTSAYDATILVRLPVTHLPSEYAHKGII